MCLGIPGEIVELLDDRPDLAKVDVSGVKRAINIGLLEDEKTGRLGADPRRLRPVQDRRGGGKGGPRLPRGIGQAYADELTALAESRIE